MNNNKKKLAVYVDGFNLYHALQKFKKPYLKWLNLRSLAEKFIDHNTEVIEKVYYFSAIATHLEKEPIIRHRAYIEALATAGIEFIGGNFKKKPLRYKNKHLELVWHKHEEKETDVNIAIYMVRDAVARLFDKLILITNDTDIVPAIKMAKTENKLIEIKILTPPTFSTHDSLREAIRPGKCISIAEKHVELSLFPSIIKKTNGKIIHVPLPYRK